MKNVNDSVKLLQNLKDATIIRYLDEIDTDLEIDLYNVMFRHFANGDLDDVFFSHSLKGLSRNQCIEILRNARDYQGLCFYKSNPDNWLESLEDVAIEDYSFISYQVLNNYDFMLDILRRGGRSVLEQLSNLSKYDSFFETPIIEYLRNIFVNDEILKTVILKISSSNSCFDIFTDKQKSILMRLPEGILYFYEKDGIKIASPVFLALEIYNRINEVELRIDEGNDSGKNGWVILQLKEFFQNDNLDFLDIIMEMSDDYQDIIGELDLESIDNANISNNVVKAKWNIENSLLDQISDSSNFNF